MIRKALAIGSTLVYASLMMGCFGNSVQTTNNTSVSDKALSMVFALPSGSLDSLSTATVILSASDMDTIQQALTVKGDTVSGTVKKIPLGYSRHIEVTIYDKAKVLSYYGDAYVDILSGKTVNVNILLHCVSGTVVINGTVVDTINDSNTVLPKTLWTKVTYFDFHSDGSCPDFESPGLYGFVNTGEVQDTLGLDGLPISSADPMKCIYTQDVRRWYTKWQSGRSINYLRPVYMDPNT